ncbi:hypothetical protein [Pontibacter beigongshangensis]|uniref:hypothetical protein n=1 Tax=Pontibacter beigongshangensis TaxID=2574733 RepID=UPI001650B5AC|nr:hypothetical protein [Pontibacter beigongshangensis]
MAEKQLTAEEQIAQLKAELAKSNSEKEEQAALIDEQNERLALAEAQKGRALPVVQDSKKKKYQVLAAKFQHPVTGEDVKADELAKDKNLIDLLIEKKSGLLVAYVEPSK